MVTVTVKNGNVDRAMRTLKKKLQKEGLLKELKQRQFFEKPSAKKARKKAEGIKRYQRNLKKKQESGQRRKKANYSNNHKFSIFLYLLES